MSDEPQLERRPARGYGRDEDTAEALRSLEKWRKRWEAGQRPRRRGGLTIEEAKRRMKLSMGIQ
jgi:hypothetical protein